MILSDAPNCGLTYNRHYENRDSFIIQATVVYAQNYSDAVALALGQFNTSKRQAHSTPTCSVPIQIVKFGK
jgi:hypothetical protein